MSHSDRSRAEHEGLKEALASQYRIERELGRGGFATVFLAHDVRHERPVAIKVLHPEIAATLGNDRFKREIRLAARLQHPHILGVHDSGETNNQLWFAMPFVEGESLRDRLNRERQLPIADAIRIAREAAGALDYAHRHDVIHRDIKPENILLTEGHALVADFGIARALRADALTQTGVAIGTPAYMSPEQSSGAAIDARTDVYSLGCVLYEMLVGEAPFMGPTPQVVMSRALTDVARPIRATRSTVSPALEAVVARAMAKVPADRFAHAAELEKALEGLAAETQVPTAAAVTAPATVVVMPPRAPRVPVWALAVGALAIAGAAVAGFRWWSGRPADAHTMRLAVLPFDNLGAADDDYFADGIADDVRGKLAAVPGLQVIARASAIQYKKVTSKSPQQIGQELDVDYLLTGTVRWEKGQGDARRVRVSPELIQASTGTTRWQQPFDTELHDVFKVQADIAERVADALNVALGASTQAQLDAPPTGNVAAYDAYLRGMQEAQTGAGGRLIPLRNAIEYFENAVALDASFAEAWAQLSRAACGIVATTPTPPDVDRCRVAAERATQLAADKADSRLSMAEYLRVVVRDYDKALEQIGLGLQVAPNNSELLAASARIERQLGRRDSALVHLQHAVRMDPRSLSAFRALGIVYHDLHRYDEAIAAYDRAGALAPTSPAVVQSMAAVFLSRGDLDGARRVIAAALDKVGAKTLVVSFATFQEMMWVLPDDLRASVVTLTADDFGKDEGMWALKVGATYRLMGDEGHAREYGARAAATYDPIAHRYADDPQQQELWGRALALAGRCDEAIAAARRSLDARRMVQDQASGPYYRYQVARIYIQCHQYDRALDLLEEILATPSMFTPAWLRIDPIFAALAGNPRFTRLVAAK